MQLRALRIAAGLTQQQLAERMGVSHNRVSGMERYPQTLRVGTLAGYLAALGGALELAVVFPAEGVRVVLYRADWVGVGPDSED